MLYKSILILFLGFGTTLSQAGAENRSYNLLSRTTIVSCEQNFDVGDVDGLRWPLELDSKVFQHKGERTVAFPKGMTSALMNFIHEAETKMGNIVPESSPKKVTTSQALYGISYSFQKKEDALVLVIKTDIDFRNFRLDEEQKSQLTKEQSGRVAGLEKHFKTMQALQDRVEIDLKFVEGTAMLDFDSDRMVNLYAEAADAKILFEIENLVEQYIGLFFSFQKAYLDGLMTDDDWSDPYEFVSVVDIKASPLYIKGRVSSGVNILNLEEVVVDHSVRRTVPTVPKT